MSDFVALVGDSLRIRGTAYQTNAHADIQDLTGKDLHFEAFDVGTTTAVVDLTEGSGIELINETAGTFEVHLLPAHTELLGEDGGALRYRLRLIDGADVYTLAHGKIVLRQVP